MARVENIQVTCDKCNNVTTTLPDCASPLPDGWMQVQGYAIIQNGTIAAVQGEFCPVCIQQFGAIDLVKTAADLAQDLVKAS